MKAAVLHELGKAPRCEEFVEPTAGKDEALVRVRAASLKGIDRQLPAERTTPVRENCRWCAERTESETLRTARAYSSAGRGGLTARWQSAPWRRARFAFPCLMESMMTPRRRCRIREFQ